MRHVRLLGVASALCAFAIAATPALAHEFTASKTGNTSGTAESEQKFKFGPFKITCEKAKAKGAQAAGSSSTLTVAVRFASCTDEIRFGTKPAFVPTRFLTPLAITYHANGYVETGSETEEFEGSAVLAGGSAEIKVYTGVIPGSPKEKSRCTIVWPEQTLPLKAIKKPEGEYSAATYSNLTRPKTGKAFPEGLQTYVSIANAFKGIKYEFEGEPCEEWGKEEGPEGGGGTFFGSFPVFLNAGNLEFS